jgi:hypothetical protein
MREYLELPRPWVLLRTTTLSLAESAGLPIAALAIGAWLGGRDAGLLAGLAATWVIAIVRKIATGSVPSLLKILTIELTVQTVIVIATGQLWIFLLHFPLANVCLFVLFARAARCPNPLLARLAAEVVGLRQPATHYPGLLRFFQDGTWLWAGIFLLLAATMTVLLVTEPTAAFLLGSTIATIALILAGAGVSVLWLRCVLRRAGLGVRFALTGRAAVPANAASGAGQAKRVASRRYRPGRLTFRRAGNESHGGMMTSSRPRSTASTMTSAAACGLIICGCCRS